MARRKHVHLPVTRDGRQKLLPGLSAAERGVIEANARRLVGRRRYSVLSVARGCMEEMARVRAAEPTHRAAPLSFSTVYTYLKRTAYRFGSRPVGTQWCPSEDRIVERHARASVEGRFGSMADAVASCRAALQADRRRLGRAAPQERTPSAVRDRIQRFISGYGLPACQRLWSPAESRIVDRYVRGLMAGRFRSTAEAAAACLPRLLAFYRRRAARQGVSLRPAGRSLEAVQGRVMVQLRRTGWHRCDAPRWSPVERRIAAKWLERWRRFRHSSRPWTVMDAARELRDELSSRGVKRTTHACNNELLLQKAGRIAADRFCDRPPKPPRPRPAPSLLRSFSR